MGFRVPTPDDALDAVPESLAGSLAAVLDNPGADGCGCEATFDDETLVVDAESCPHDGRLEDSEDCRAVVVEALTDRDATTVRTEAGGVERAYEDDAAALLVAAGRFAEAVRFHDERLAERATRDPLAAAREATGRAGPAPDVAAETGLAELAARAAGYETALAPYVGPAVSRWRVETAPPAAAQLATVRELDTGATVRQYAPETGPTRYYLDPLDRQLSGAELEVLSTAYRRLATGEFEGGDRAPGRAVRAVVDDGDAPEQADGSHDHDGDEVRTERVAAVLGKHTRGHGLLEDLFADPALSDAFVTAPAPENCLRVTVDGETLVTNVRLTETGVAALASQFRRESGRAFSRADPTLDADPTVGNLGGRVERWVRP